MRRTGAGKRGRDVAGQAGRGAGLLLLVGFFFCCLFWFCWLVGLVGLVFVECLSLSVAPGAIAEEACLRCEQMNDLSLVAELRGK